MKARFVKGHMGGNTIAIFRRDEFPAGRELALVLEALDNKSLACHEAGLVSPGSSQDHLCLSIVGRSSRNWISACGGLTQVLGKALADEASCQNLGLTPLSPPADIVFETEAGPTPVHLTGEGENITVRTDMTAFVEEIRRDGFEEITLRGIPVRRIGKFLAIDAEVLEKVHPSQEIERLCPAVRRTIIEIQKGFFAHLGRESRDTVIYDAKPTEEGHFRVSFPHYLPENHIEPACGTGSVAAGVALFLAGALKDRLRADKGTCEIVFESGGGPSLGGPERTTLLLKVDKGHLRGAAFSHSRVELTAVGDVFLPEGNCGR